MAKKQLLNIVKLVISCIALWLVFRKVNASELLVAFRTTNFGYLLIAILFFMLSKLISAYRLNSFFKASGLNLSNKINLQLYWLGMYYNLFLPGGIGGDGYKIWWINKNYIISPRQSFWAIVFDRLSGLAALFILIGLLAFSKPVFNQWRIWIAFLIIGGFLIFWFITQLFSKEYKSIFLKTNLQGLLVQVIQMLSVVFILQSLRIEQHYTEYLLVFLISSVVAVLPFTLGGLGARELVFVWGSQYLHLDMHFAVTVSLWFYIITALVSLMGVYYAFNESKLTVGSQSV